MVNRIEKLEARVLLDGSLSAIDADKTETNSAVLDFQTDENQTVLETITFLDNELFIIDADLDDLQSIFTNTQIVCKSHVSKCLSHLRLLCVCVIIYG